MPKLLGEVMHAALNSFDRFAVGNKPFLLNTLEKEFSLDSLLKAAKANGFNISDAEVNDQMGRLIDESRVHISYQDSDGEIRELTVDEATMAAGGSAYAIAVAAVVAAVGVAVAVSVYAGAYTQVAVYAQVYLWG